MPAFRAVLDVGGLGKVQVDGRDVPSCAGFTVHAGAGEAADVSIRLAGPEMNLNLADASVTLAPDQAAVLEAMGWTHRRFIDEARAAQAAAEQRAAAAESARLEAEQALGAARERVAELEGEGAALRARQGKYSADLEAARTELAALAAGKE